MVFPSVSCLGPIRARGKVRDGNGHFRRLFGFILWLATAKSYIESGMAEKILLIGVDTLSKITNWSDRSTAVLFGDGAGAASSAAALEKADPSV